MPTLPLHRPPTASGKALLAQVRPVIAIVKRREQPGVATRPAAVYTAMKLAKKL